MCNAIISKTCSKCKTTKPLSEFWKGSQNKDGRRSQCKLCMAASQKKYQHTDRGKATRKIATVRYEQSEKGKRYHRQYRLSKKGKAVQATYRRTEKGKRADKRYKTAHPLRIQARQAVSGAVRYGKLPRARTLHCTYCDKLAQEYHHHHGYEEPFWLDVVPTCVGCHPE